MLPVRGKSGKIAATIRAAFGEVATDVSLVHRSASAPSLAALAARRYAARVARVARVARG